MRIVSVKSLVSSVSRNAGHFCARASCKHCVARTLSTCMARTFATKPSRQENKDYEISKLSKFINQEIECHREIIKDEELTLDRVMEEYGKLIRENNISIEKDEDDKVKMIIPRENGIKYILKFDPCQVADSVNATPEEESMEEDAEEMAATEVEDAENFDDDGKMPFNVSLEVHRQGQEKFMTIEAEVSPSFEEEDYDIFVTDLYIDKPGTTYNGPSFDSLDDDLRDQFEQLASKNFRRFMPLVADYAVAKEAALYTEWLKDLQEIAAGTKN